MISEIALLPNVFRNLGDNSGTVHDTCVAQLSEFLLSDGVVRDLRKGEWRRAVLANAGALTIAHQKLVETLVKSNRLREFPESPFPSPSSNDDWLYEALWSRKAGGTGRPLVATISDQEIADRMNDSSIVSVERLHESYVWKSRSTSVRLNRNTKEYINILKPLLGLSNSLMFIDPYLDPMQESYREFGELLKASVRSDSRPDLIEIHRSEKESGNIARIGISCRRNYWMERFEGLGRLLRKSGLRATVFVWRNFHDRFLISDLMALSLPYGFDISTSGYDGQKTTTWSKISRKDADDIRREFDQSNQSRLVFEPFEIGIDD